MEHAGRCIGRAGVLWPERWPEPELAYAQAREAWGQGLATEAAAAARDWAFGVGSLKGLVSFTRPDNSASQAVA